MTIHEALFTPTGEPLMTVCLLLLTLQMALILASFRNNRSGRIKTLYFLPFAIGFAFFYLLMLDICWAHDDTNGEKARPAILAAFGSLPLAVMLLLELLFALALIAAFRDFMRYRKTHPSFESVKETMDLLPVGIAFAKPDGTVVFSNLAVNRLSRALTGRAFTDLEAFCGITAGENEAQLTLPDASVWQLTSNALNVDREEYVQLTAADISEQAAITRQLEEKNAKLRDIHMRLDIYNRQADRIIIAQELLSARMAVHNEVGNVLLESRHYLQDPASFDEEKLLQALKNTNTYLLREYEEDDTARDPLAEALETAEAIGVDVAITGMIPAKEPFRGILAAAVSECASNAVKHAKGDQLQVTITLIPRSPLGHPERAPRCPPERSAAESKDLCITLRSNGEAPVLPIRETGGLKSLRTLVEKEEGTMQAAAAPAFTLTIRLPVPSAAPLSLSS